MGEKFTDENLRFTTKKGLSALIFHGLFWYHLLSLTLTYPAGGKEGAKNTFLLLV